MMCLSRRGSRALGRYDIDQFGAPLIDGSTIYIPFLKTNGDGKPLLKNHTSYLLSASPPTIPENDGVSNASRVNINTATQRELETLPGVGASYAQAIITYRVLRPFENIEDVMVVRRIGGKRYEHIREMISVR